MAVQRCTTKQFQVRTLHLLLAILDHVRCQELPQPMITISEPLRLGKVVHMCCTAESKTFGEPVVEFLISPNNDKRKDNFPVSSFDISVEQCYSITVTTQHHGSSAECSAKYPSGRGRSATPFPFVVMELSQPVITGPRSLQSGAAAEYFCRVQEVTYDTRFEFTLTWRVNGVPDQNDKQNTVNRGYLDTAKKRLAMHRVNSCINIRAPVNHGNTPTTLLLECVVFHVGLEKFGKQIITSYNVSIQPDPTTTTTTTTPAPGELDGGGGGGDQTISDNVTQFPADQTTSKLSATSGFFVTQSRAHKTTSIATFNKNPELSGRGDSSDLMMVFILSLLVGLALLVVGGIFLVRYVDRRLRKGSKDSLSRRPSFEQLQPRQSLTSAGNMNSMAAGGRRLSFTFDMPPSAQPYAASAPSESSDWKSSQNASDSPSEYSDWESSQYTSDGPTSELDASSYSSSVIH